MNIIIKAIITKTSGNGRVANAILSNGEKVELFSYYEDEIVISEYELENKSVDEARELKRSRQINWENSYNSIFDFGKTNSFSISGNTL